MTPLHIAASKCNCEMISLLLEHNANILAKTQRNSTPFKLAQTKKDDPTCQNSYQKATKILKDAEEKLGPQEVAMTKYQKATIYFVSTYPVSEFFQKSMVLA